MSPPNTRLERTVMGRCPRAASALRYVARASRWTRLRSAAQPDRSVRALRVVLLRSSPMAFLHIAWFRFNEGVSPDRIERHLASCRALVGKEPVLRTLQCGPYTSNRACGLTNGIVVTLPDASSLPQYLEHPAHLPVAQALVAD